MADKRDVDWTQAEDVTAKYLPKTIELATKGDPVAKRRLLEIFCAMVDAGETPYRTLLEYLSSAISQALGEKDKVRAIGKALVGAAGRGRQMNPETQFRHWHAAWSVAEFRAGGMSLVDAVSAAADELQGLGLDDDAILTAYKAYNTDERFRQAVAALLSRNDADT